MLINAIYLYLIFRLRFLSPFLLRFILTSHVNLNERFTFLSKPSRSNFGPFSKLRRMPPSPRTRGSRDIGILFIFNGRHRGFDFTRACVSLCKAWHLQDMKINRTRQNCAPATSFTLRSPAIPPVPRAPVVPKHNSVAVPRPLRVLSSGGSRPFAGYRVDRKFQRVSFAACFRMTTRPRRG